MADAKEWETVGMTVDETAAVLRVDRNAVLRALKEKGLPARKVGRGYRIAHSAIEPWLAAGSVAEEADTEEE